MSSSVSLAILSTHKRIRKVSLAGLGSFYLFTNVLVFAHFLFINAVYTVSVKDALLWILLFLQIFYMLYGKPPPLCLSAHLSNTIFTLPF